MSAPALKNSPIQIVPYQERFKDAIGKLIVGIQRGEFNVPITLEEQPDLANIPAVYQKAGGQFWIALDGDTLAGTVALINAGNGVGVIRKMFVAKEYRQSGLGQELLDTLVNHAKAQRMDDLYLGTLDRLEAARRLYAKNGFKVVDNNSLPPELERIRMKVDTLHYHRKVAL